VGGAIAAYVDPDPFSKVFFGYQAAHALDQATADFRQAWDGEYHDTLQAYSISAGLQAMGVSQDSADRWGRRSDVAADVAGLLYSLKGIIPGRSRPVSLTPADFADEAAEIQRNAAISRGLSPNSDVLAAKLPQDIELSKLIYPESRPCADPAKLIDHGPFNWALYTPIWVETDGRRFWLMNGVTRVDNAKRSQITKLPALIFKR
jgi:hypothetical protein